MRRKSEANAQRGVPGVSEVVRSSLVTGGKSTSCPLDLRGEGSKERYPDPVRGLERHGDKEVDSSPLLQGGGRQQHSHSTPLRTFCLFRDRPSHFELCEREVGYLELLDDLRSV